MRLKSYLQGFKVFADRTEFVFDALLRHCRTQRVRAIQRLRAFSNWVLGEQSAHCLRRRCDDGFIFNGSGTASHRVWRKWSWFSKIR